MEGTSETAAVPHAEGDGASVPAREHPVLTRHESSVALKESGSLSKEQNNRSEKGHKRTASSSSSTDLKFVAKLKPSLKKNLSESAPISKELSERARSAPLVKKFNLPPTETLLNDYSAALLKHILIHGRMYVSQNYICFESKIFGIKTMEVIPFKDVTVLTKKSMKLKFAHGIEISTPSQTYYFASFVSRRKAFSLLTQIWRQHVPKDDQLPDEDDDDDDDDEAAQDYESDDSTLNKTKKEKRLSKENTDGNLGKLGRSVECTPDHPELKELELAKEKGLRRFSSPLLSRVLPNGKHSSSTGNITSTTSMDMHSDADSTATSPTSVTSPTSTTTSPTPTTPTNAAASSASLLNNISASTSSIVSEPPSAPESEEEDNYDSGDGFLGSEAVFQQVLCTNFEVNVKTFFKLFFSDESTFTQLYHGNRGDKDLSVKKWSNSPQFGMIRDVLFLSPVKVPLGPSHTRITETQRYHLSKNRLLIDTISMMLDIPYGDSFRVEGKWDVTSVTQDSCKLIVNIGVHFMKKTWFKGKIETQTIKETKESFQQWASLAPAEITKYKTSLAQSPTGQPQPIPTTTAPSTRPSPPPTQTTTTPPPNPQPPSPVVVPPEPTYVPMSHRNFESSTSSPFGMVKKSLTSMIPSNILEGQSLASMVLVILVVGVFLHMYLRIVYLEGKVVVMENIVHSLLAKKNV